MPTHHCSCNGSVQSKALTTVHIAPRAIKRLMKPRLLVIAYELMNRPDGMKDVVIDEWAIRIGESSLGVDPHDLWIARAVTCLITVEAVLGLLSQGIDVNAAHLLFLPFIIFFLAFLTFFFLDPVFFWTPGNGRSNAMCELLG